MPEILKKYGNFSELATRSEYWGVMLISWVVGLLALGIGLVFWTVGWVGAFFGVIIILTFGVITFWLNLATTVRRCRDAGINVWFVLTLFIPYINWIPLIVFGVLPTAQKSQV